MIKSINKINNFQHIKIINNIFWKNKNKFKIKNLKISKKIKLQILLKNKYKYFITKYNNNYNYNYIINNFQFFLKNLKKKNCKLFIIIKNMKEKNILFFLKNLLLILNKKAQIKYLYKLLFFILFKHKIKNNKIIIKKNKIINIKNKILNYFSKNGNKQHINNKFILAFKKIKHKYNLNTIKIYKKIIKSLNISIESKQIKYRHNTIIIPFPIHKNRSQYLIAKWLFLAIKKNKKKLSLEKKIIKEVTRIIKKKKSTAFYLKLQNMKLAIKNRAYMHYRW